mmetsp:Transcript_34907/g.81658  ORF Transcript_34907/g.81658 Transcript_34907/m.81658 type:complete len:469 (+) Transcript_34907:50-1456(+)
MVVARALTCLATFVALLPCACSVDTSICGCSWSIEKGCSISSIQLVSSLKKAAWADKLCNSARQTESAASDECKIGEHMKETARQFEACIDSSKSNARECNDYSDGLFCQWEAQEQGKCGLDPEKLVVQLTNTSGRSHEFVKWVRLTDICADQSEATCSAQEGCKWMQQSKSTSHSRGLAHCDVDEAVLVESMLTHPRLYQMIRIYMRSAMCLRNRQLNPNECPQPCHKGDLQNQCSLPRDVDWDAISQLIDATCNRATDNCTDPCMMDQDGNGHLICTGPTMLPMQLQMDVMSAEDMNVANTLMILSAATNPYDQRCATVKSKEECDKVADHCKGDLHGDDTSTITTFGLSDTIANVLDAANAGTLGDEVSSYMEKNPKSGNKALSALVRSFGNVFEQELSSMSPTPAPPEKEEPAAVSSWLVFFGIVMVIAICVGMAYGQVAQRLGLGGSTTELAQREMYKRVIDG